MTRFKKITIAAIWMCVSMTVAVGQDDKTGAKQKSYRHGATIETEYNKERDETKVELKQMFILRPKVNPTHNLNITAYFTYPGKQPAKPESVIMGIVSASFDRQNKFEDLRELKVQIGTESVSFGPMELLTSRIVSGYYKEVLGIAIPFESFLRMVNGDKDSMEMSVGLARFTLDKKNLDALRDLAGRVE
jgi:hypothetical protein